MIETVFFIVGIAAKLHGDAKVQIIDSKIRESFPCMSSWVAVSRCGESQCEETPDLHKHTSR